MVCVKLSVCLHQFESLWLRGQTERKYESEKKAELAAVVRLARHSSHSLSLSLAFSTMMDKIH